MMSFSTTRERGLWICTFITLLAILASTFFAPPIADTLRQRGLLELAFAIGVSLIGLFIVWNGLKDNAGPSTLILLLGVAAVYLLAFTRIALPEERTHLVEYGVLGVLIYEALVERARNARQGPPAALSAILITGALGVVDEVIQLFLPSRVFDLRDIGFNLFAGTLAVTTCAALERVSRGQDESG